MRMFRGTFHMMLLRLNASSHAIVIEDVRPSPRPAVWSVRRPPPNRNTGNNISAHRRARDNRDPLLERIVERLQVRAELPHGAVEGRPVVGVDRRLECGQVLPRTLQPLDHRVVVLVEPVELVLLDSDGGAETGVPCSAWRTRASIPSSSKITLPRFERLIFGEDCAADSRAVSSPSRKTFIFSWIWMRSRLSAARMSSRRR